MRTLLGLAFGLVAFGVVQAADLNDPVWDRAPGQDDWAKAYPAHAAQAGISGAVKMKCAATADGMLSGCAVIQETPSGEGFGTAALSLASGMALKPAGENGQPVAGRNLIVPVRFEAAMLRHPGTIIGQPDWQRRPTQEETQRFFPANARGEEGKTSIECVVSSRGLLEKCEIHSESPTGHGFGESALAMSSVFIMRPMTVDGLPVGGAKVIIPIGFQGAPDAGMPSGATIKIMRAAPWMAAPTAQALSAAFPKGAVGKAATAHVVLRCGFRDDGGLDDCETVSEAPDLLGFATAAKSLTKDFRAYVNPKTDKLMGLRVDIPFDFRDPSQPTPPMEVYDPIWLRQVNPEYVGKLFPIAAAKAGLKTGVASVECSVQHDGTLKDCIVASEDPAGMGFGDAALQVASVMAMNPWTAQGDPVDGARIRLPVRLELPAGAEPPAPAQQASPKP
jgi:TonB family protein